MDMTFDKGDQSQPKGHALLYYRTGSQVLATYIVVLPLTMDFSKYIPPFLASQIKGSGMEEFSAFAIPPIPEEVESYEFLENLAGIRGDDLVSGGEAPGDDPMESAQRVNDAVQEYMRIYQGVAEIPKIGQGTGSEPSELDVNEVMVSLMGDREKLGELSKLLSKLRFAVDGNDSRLAQETEVEIQTLAKSLPERYSVTQLIEATSRTDAQGASLAQLYLERCYKLVGEDYIGVQQVEKAIQELQDGDSQTG